MGMQSGGSRPVGDSRVARIRPRLVVSWYSTVLAEALQSGIVPVTVCTPEESNAGDVVYRLFDRALCWPREVQRLEAVLNDDNTYKDTIAALSEYEGDQ